MLHEESDEGRRGLLTGRGEEHVVGGYGHLQYKRVLEYLSRYGIRYCSGGYLAIQKGTRVLVSLWDSLMFGYSGTSQHQGGRGRAEFMSLSCARSVNLALAADSLASPAAFVMSLRREGLQGMTRLSF